MPLTQDRNTPFKDADSVVVPVAANAKIFAGALVCANATGFAVPGSVATTLTYLGRAEQFVNNTGGADGALQVIVRRKKAFKWKNHAADLLVQADLGKTVYIVDDETVAKTNGGATRSAGGKLIQFESDGVWVE